LLVIKVPKFTHTTPLLKSLHWLKVNGRIEYKILSLTYKLLNPLMSNDVQRGGGLPPGCFLPRIFGTDKNAMVCFYDFYSASA